MERLASMWGVTPQAAAFIVMAADPFHDTQVPTSGLPDASVDPSYTFEVKKKVQITMPAGVTAPWDCHIFNLPLLTRMTFHQGNQLNSGVWYEASTAPDITLGLLNIVCAPSGTDALPNQTNGIVLAANDFVTGPEIDNFLAGNSRILAFGFETHDVTADLYKQGTLTCYRQSSHPVSTSMFHYVGNSTAFNGAAQNMYMGPADRLVMPPVNAQAAFLLPGSVEWKAEEGAYSVVPFSSFDMPVEPLKTGQVYICDTDSDHQGNAGLITKTENTFGAFASKPGITVNTGLHTFCGGSAYRLAPIMQCGQYFTGLAAQSTITLTVKLVIERCPDVTQPDLVVLAKPSPLYEPRAFEQYMRLVATSQPAVPVRMNPGGEFWHMLIDGASTVASMAFPEAAPLIGIANSLANMAVSKATAKKQAKKAARAAARR